MDYAAWKKAVLGRQLLSVQGIVNPYGVECVTLVWDYANYLFSNVPITQTISTGNAKDIFANANPAYFQKIANDVNNPNQLPEQGDVMVFSETPYPGYTNQFDNPYGHTGVCDSADSNGYNLLQQNAPGLDQAVNVTHYAWKFRHCIGWLRPIEQTAPPVTVVAPVVAPATPEVTAPTPVVAVESPPISDPSVSSPVATPAPVEVIAPEVLPLPTVATVPTILPTPAPNLPTIVNKGYNMLSYIKLHVPAIIAVVLVVLNSLIENGNVTLGSHVTGLINAVLAALGLGVLHYRTLNKS